MPEGDTIFRTAARLRPVLEQRTLDRAESREAKAPAQRLTGRRVDSVEARGKHLLFHFDDASALHSHMGMTGSWHLYPRGEPWRKPARRAALTLSVQPEQLEIQVVCFSPKLLEWLSRDALRRHRYLQQLGPDLLSNTFDPQHALERLRIHNNTPIGEAVMNQTVISGIGNEYKAELLFIERMSPFAPVSQFDDAALLKLLEAARVWMRRNLDGNMRRTRLRGDGGRKWVYGRSGQPCYQCGEPIQLRRQGDLGRTTYYCASCQGAS